MSDAVALFTLVAAPFVGSFLGLVIERLPRGETVIAGRSRCLACGHALGLADLVPVFSWLWLRGRCRHCGWRLSWFLPAIELAALGVVIWAMLALPGSIVLPGAVLGWSLLVLAAIDWRHRYLPDVITLPLIALGLGMALLTGGLMHHLAGAAAGGTLFMAITLFYERALGRDGLGLGDAKLLAAAGAWVGWQGLPSVVLIAAGSGLVVTMALSRGPISGRTAVPFGPYLAAGFWITWVHGPLQVG